MTDTPKTLLAFEAADDKEKQMTEYSMKLNIRNDDDAMALSNLLHKAMTDKAEIFSSVILALADCLKDMDQNQRDTFHQMLKTLTEVNQLPKDKRDTGNIIKLHFNPNSVKS